MPRISVAATERGLLVVPIAAAVVIVASGFAVAWWVQEPEWVRRSGSAVVAAESLIAILENRRRNRFERIPAVLKEKNKFIREEIERAEYQLLWVAVALAVSGELLHGFGDLLFSLLIPKT
jgi:hypothetical protein